MQKNQSPPLVWYVSYASNLGRERFLCYIQGGQAPGSRRANPGCTDRTPPRADQLLDIPFGMYFAGESQTWGGGVAFVEHAQGHRTTKARAYLITLPQFEEVVAQESYRPRTAVHLGALTENGHLVTGEGMYDKLLLCGTLDGLPMLTFTGPEVHAVVARPTANYLGVVADGLADAYAMRLDTIASYLGGIPGVGYTAATIKALLSAQPARQVA